MLENLRQTLITYRRKLEENTSDVSVYTLLRTCVYTQHTLNSVVFQVNRLKEQKDQVEKESKKYRDMLTSRDKALHVRAVDVVCK